jgi:hypothetical protein
LKTNLNKNTILKNKIRKKTNQGQKKKQKAQRNQPRSAGQASPHVRASFIFFFFFKGAEDICWEKKKHQVAHCILT